MDDRDENLLHPNLRILVMRMHPRQKVWVATTLCDIHVALVTHLEDNVGDTRMRTVLAPPTRGWCMLSLHQPPQHQPTKPGQRRRW